MSDAGSFFRFSFIVYSDRFPPEPPPANSPPPPLRLMETINAIQEDCDHKFSLQAAENKRMQQHLSTAKRENQALTKRLVALEERVAVLELELGGDDNEDEEF